MEIQRNYLNTPIQTDKAIKSVYQYTRPTSEVIQEDIQQHITQTIQERADDNVAIANMNIGKGLFLDITI